MTYKPLLLQYLQDEKINDVIAHFNSCEYHKIS